MPAMIGERALNKNLTNERAPSVVVATPDPTISRAAAVRIGWSL